MRNIKYKKTIILLLSILVIVGGYYIYDKVITFPDNNQERIIRNIMYEHNIIVDRRRAYKAGLSLKIKAFGGVYRVEDKNGNITLSPDESAIRSLINEYSTQEPHMFTTKAEYEEYFNENCKYYNKEKLEVILVLFNSECGTDLSADDIVQYVDNGNREKEDEIKEYVPWFNDHGKKTYDAYAGYFSDVVYESKKNGDSNGKYGNVIFYKLSWEQKKEAMETMINDGVKLQVEY